MVSEPLLLVMEEQVLVIEERNGWRESVEVMGDCLLVMGFKDMC